MRGALRDVAWRVAGLFRRGRMDRRLDDEMQFHLDMLTQRYRSAGLPLAEARRRALAEFGGTERFKDAARDEYRSRVVEETVQDVRYAVRVLRHYPGFTVAAALTFALGIGASTAVFSVVNGVLLRSLPYADPDRLVVVWERHPGRGVERNVVAVPNFEAWRERSQSFTAMAGVVPLPATIGGAPNPERVVGAEVSPGYFQLLGVRPALGREFAPEEEADGGANVVMLSDGFWRAHFGADPNVLGRTLPIDGRAHTVVGVMPPTFDPPRFSWLSEQAFWRPFGPTESNRSWGRFLLVVARLEDRTTIDAARREMAAVADGLAREERSNVGWSASITTLESEITGEVRSPLLILLGAVGLLLVMAIANVTNLTLALARRRVHELAVRRAIGATSWRLVRQLVTQSAVVGALGGVVGAAGAVVGVRGLVVLLPPELPRADGIRVDGAVLTFLVIAAGVASLVIGLVSALRALPGAVATTLGESSGRSARRLRGGSLVTAEIALGLVLTVLAGLMVRTFVALRAVDVGFESDRVVAVRVGLSGPRYSAPDARSSFFADVLEQVRGAPGVQGAGLINIRPFGGTGPATTVADANARAVSDSLVADVRLADAEVFQALRIRLLAGGLFDARDRVGRSPRVVINESLARALWPGGPPIGRRLRLEMYNGITPEVIGVVGDVHLMDARTPPRPTAYLATTAFPSEIGDLIVRGRDVTALVAAVRGAVRERDATIPVYQADALETVIGRTLARDRFTTLLLGGFAVVALMLAAVGIYGVFAADVAERRKEIGIRVALGAPSAGVVRLVMSRAARRALMGVSIGSVGARLAANGMKSMLFGVESTDPTSFIGVAVLLLSVAFVATLVPAVRASRVSPLVAIRTD